MVQTSTDANGNVTRFAYDGNGFLNARRDPASNTTTYVNNDLGWRTNQTDPLGYPTSYSYDLNGNVVTVQDALPRTFTRTYDPNGNLLSASDGMRQLTVYAYDVANQRTNMTDRTGTSWVYFYTSRGKLEHATDPLGNSVTNFCDSANRLIRVSDPIGQSIMNQYDGNGNLIAIFDKAGQRWTKTYDRLNRVIGEADPIGNTKQTTYDVADRIQQITSANGFPSLHFYDGRGRLIKWKDPQGYDWLYAYDGVGNIINIEDVLHGHYLVAYGPRNERILEHNQDGFEWHYAYDELLRLHQQTDPNGVVRTAKYDSVGRPQYVDFNTGREDAFNYDNNDNRTSISRRVAGTLTLTGFTYDQLDRVVVQNDALKQTVGYAYDPLGRATTITYPGGKALTNTYDALGRLTNQVDWAGRQTSYAYDAADRLIYRSYPNGVIQTNAFDTAGRITGLAYSSPNPPASSSNTIQVALNYAYDRNGNKTGSSESGVLEWPLPSLTDESASYTPAGRLVDRQIQNNSAISNQVSTVACHYDASGNMTNGVRTMGGSNLESWTLTYDEDNRTTSIDWEAGITHKTITNRYDALGRRISKTLDGVTTGYVLTLNRGMERVLCDLDGTGTVTAWYVHGPDLCYKVDATNGLTCYHADTMANIIALTDGKTNLVAQYAYTPYGWSLGSANFEPSILTSQPYTFVGSQGVMEELPGLFFMRARYYSAAAGVFLSTDPVNRIGPGWMPSAYIYVSGNPLSRGDPSGQFLQIIAGAAIGAVVGGGIDVAEQYFSHSTHKFDWDRFWMHTAEGGIAGTLAAATGGLSLAPSIRSGGALGVDMLLGEGEGYVANGIDNRSNLKSFNENSPSAVFSGAIGGVLSFGTDLVGESLVPNGVGRPVPSENAYASLLGRTAGPNTYRTVERAVSTAAVSDSLSEAVGQVITQVSAGLGGTGNRASSGNQSLSSRTPGVAGYAVGLNSLQLTAPAPNSSNSDPVSTQMRSDNSNNTTNSITQKVRNIATTVGQAISSAVTSVGNWIGSLFGGHP